MFGFGAKPGGNLNPFTGPLPVNIGCLRHATVQLGALDVRVVPGLSMDFAQAVLVEKAPNGDWVQVAGQWKKHLHQMHTCGLVQT